MKIDFTIDNGILNVLIEIAQVKCADRMAELHKRIRGEEYDPENPKFSKIFPF